MEKNQVVEINIDKLGMNGEGVGRVDNQVVFVPFALPNEKVKTICINNKNKFAIMKVTDVISASSDRIVPPCPYFKKCGGCDLQHLKYEKQLEFKTNLVKETLLKVGKIDTTIEPCEKSKEYGYRNKASFPIVNENGYHIGMYRVNSHNLVDIDYCYLQKDSINKVLSVTKQWLNTLNENETQSHNAKLKHLVIREIDGKILITLVVSDKKVYKLDDYVKLLQNNFDDFGLNLNINKLDNNVILSNEYIHIYGNKDINIETNGVRQSINNASFYQVNDDIKDKIYQFVTNKLKDDVIIDAFSGAGLLTSYLSKKAKKVYGLEIVRQASQSADLLIKQNNITNVENICGDCSETLPKLVRKINDSVSVVLDPPRKGCDKKVLEALIVSKPNKIVYIACSPISLARDVNILLSSGLYKITCVKPFDMFPETKNVETVMVLEKIATK